MLAVAVFRVHSHYIRYAAGVRRNYKPDRARFNQQATDVRITEYGAVVLL
jgi:hypothetical protein